jgi:cation-transporting ATPase E
MVPEGLILLMTIAFAAAVVRLAQRRVLVQELPAVEGLARVDVLCIDKTGTLTEGKLVVTSVSSIDGLGPVEDALAAIAAVDEHPNATLRAIAERFPTAPEGWASRDPSRSPRRGSGARRRSEARGRGSSVAPTSCWGPHRPRMGSGPRWPRRRRRGTAS